MNETMDAANSTELLDQLAPSPEAGESILTTIMGWISTLIHETTKFILNATLGFLGMTTLDDSQVAMILLVAALILAFMKWRMLYGLLKTYGYAILILLCLLILGKVLGII